MELFWVHLAASVESGKFRTGQPSLFVLTPRIHICSYGREKTLLPTSLLLSCSTTSTTPPLYRAWLTEPWPPESTGPPKIGKVGVSNSLLPFWSTHPYWATATSRALSSWLEACLSGEKEGFMKLAWVWFSVGGETACQGTHVSFPNASIKANWAVWRLLIFSKNQ